MAKQNPWKVVKAEDIAADRFSIRKEVVKVSKGVEQNFSYIRFSDGVCVLALTEDQQVIVLHQYRHAVGKWEYEFPAGMIDDGEEPAEAAKRELLEETGYQADEWHSLGFFHPSPGSTSETIHLFAATKARLAGAPSLEDSEEIDMVLMDVEEVQALIKTGEFRHGGGLAALLRYQLQQK